MADTRKTWSSRIGFVLASAGAAVGLGAIWKFPYMVGTNGGSAFVFPYILMTFTVGLVLLIAEVALGRVGRGGIVTAYRNLGGKAWVPAGYLGVLTGFLVLCFYSAIGGWTLSYFCDALTGTTVMPDQAALGEHFGRLTADPVTAMGFQWLFLLLNGLILALDVTKGIERVSKLLMPLLFILMLVLIGRGLTLPGAWDGVEYLFAFRPEAFSWDAMLQAMGFTFFSLCVGCGCMLTYGSYLDEDSNLLTGCSWIAFLGVIASLLGGLMIMPAVFAFGLTPDAGPGLTFATMPAVFANLPAGQFFAVVFYVCLFVAALTSSISILEMSSQYLVDEQGFHKKNAIGLTTGVLAVLGTLSALSFGVLSDVKLFGKTIFDLFDYATSNIGMPIGVLGIAVVCGWIAWPMTRSQLTGNQHWPAWLLQGLRVVMTIVAPVVIVAVMLKGLGLF